MPGLHRRALVRAAVKAASTASQEAISSRWPSTIWSHSLRAAAEVARIGSKARSRGVDEPRPGGGILREGRAGQVDAPHGGVQYGMDRAGVRRPRSARLRAVRRTRELPEPRRRAVEMTSDELARSARSPAARHVRGHDRLRARRLCLESKSLKLYLAAFRNEGALLRGARGADPGRRRQALELTPERVSVALQQKARGGITIVAST